jgi:malic enzyme
MALHWSPNPSTIGAEIVRRAAQVKPALGELAKSHASRGEAAMKANAPWGDRTGNARQGLFGEAEGTTITLGGTAEYQIFLEKGTSKIAPRPIIMPTAETTAAEYFADAEKVVRGILG